MGSTSCAFGAGTQIGDQGSTAASGNITASLSSIAPKSN